MSDGTTEAYTANVISDNIFAQCDNEGNMYTLMDEIIDHRKDSTALTEKDAWIHTKTGTKHRKITTGGWQLLVQFKDNTARWVRLSDLKAYFPIQMAEYAVGNSIQSEPAFVWWVRDQYIFKAKTRYWKRTHKYGIELPKSVQEALKIDQRTGTTFWRDALAKEMKNVMIAFEFTEGCKQPPFHEYLGCHC